MCRLGVHSTGLRNTIRYGPTTSEINMKILSGIARTLLYGLPATYVALETHALHAKEREDGLSRCVFSPSSIPTPYTQDDHHLTPATIARIWRENVFKTFTFSIIHPVKMLYGIRTLTGIPAELTRRTIKCEVDLRQASKESKSTS